MRGIGLEGGRLEAWLGGRAEPVRPVQRQPGLRDRRGGDGLTTAPDSGGAAGEELDGSDRLCAETPERALLVVGSLIFSLSSK